MINTRYLIKVIRRKYSFWLCTAVPVWCIALHWDICAAINERKGQFRVQSQNNAAAQDTYSLQPIFSECSLYAPTVQTPHIVSALAAELVSTELTWRQAQGFTFFRAHNNARPVQSKSLRVPNSGGSCYVTGTLFKLRASVHWPRVQKVFF